MLPPSLWVILTWGRSSAERCSASREPQSEVNLLVVNAEAGLKEIQKSASAGEQSQVTTSAREEKKQHSSWASEASSGIFSRRETELCPSLTAAKVQLIAALPAFQQVLINNLFIFHVISIFKCEYLPADTGRLQEPFPED